MTRGTARLIGAFGIMVGGLTLMMPSADASDEACRGTDAEAQTSILKSREILGIRELGARRGKQMRWATDGVELFLAPKRGDSAAFLGRIARCQASASVSTNARTELLSLPGAQVSVREHPDTFGLRITSKDRKVARRALELARKLYGAHKSS